MATALLRISQTVHYTVLYLNINSDQIFIQFSPFMIQLNSTWGCQLASGCHVSIRHCATCTCMYILDCITFENWNVMSLELEAFGTLMLVLVVIYQFCSQFHLVPEHVDYQ